VLIVLPHLKTGGGQQLALDEAIGLSKKPGYEVSILCIGKKEDNIFTQKAEKNNITVSYIGKADGTSYSAMWKTTRFIKKAKPDIVHTHLLALPYTLPAAKFYKKIRFFHTVHSIAEREAGRMAKFERYAYKHTNFIPIGISDYCAKTICDFYVLAANMVPIVYNGIDTKRFSCTKEYSERKGTLKIISTGRFESVKRHTWMVEAFSEVIKTGIDAKLVFLGDGELRPEIEACIKRLNLEDRVILKGVTKQVEKELNEAHIYLLCSEFEGLPLSVLEAMSCGLPVVATKAGGTVDIVNESNGILCDIDDKKQIADALIRLASDPALREKMSAASLAMSKKYDIQKCVDEYAALFENAIRKKKG